MTSLPLISACCRGIAMTTLRSARGLVCTRAALAQVQMPPCGAPTPAPGAALPRATTSQVVGSGLSLPLSLSLGHMAQQQQLWLWVLCPCLVAFLTAALFDDVWATIHTLQVQGVCQTWPEILMLHLFHSQRRHIRITDTLALAEVLLIFCFTLQPEVIILFIILLHIATQSCHKNRPDTHILQ